MIQLPEGISRQDLEAMIDLLNSWGEKRQTEGMIDAISHFLNVSGWKQRAEAAEAALAKEKRMTSKLIQDRAVMARECNAFEAKLAELDKQEPVAWTSQANLDTLKCDSRKTLEFMTGDKNIYSNPVPLYARPAPAINLANMVPEGVSAVKWFKQQYCIQPAAVDDSLVIMENKTK